jgi:CBS domain-containing protein
MMRHTRGDPAEGPADERSSPGERLLVRDHMSRPAITVTPTTTLAEAVRVMAARKIHYLPVVDERVQLVGLVNADDALGTRSQRGLRDLVSDVMSAPAVSTEPSAKLTDAMRLMGERAIGALPVVEGGRIVGILTQSDIVAALAGRWPA